MRASTTQTLLSLSGNMSIEEPAASRHFRGCWKPEPNRSRGCQLYYGSTVSDDTPTNGSSPGKGRISRARPAEAPRSGWVGFMELNVPTAAGTGRAWGIRA